MSTNLAYQLLITSGHQKAYYDEVRALLRIIDQMDMGLFKPDVVVGLGRGGLISAVWMSHALNIPMIPIQWSTRDFAAKTANVHELIAPYNRILFLDELSDSGEAFQSLNDAIRPSTGPDQTVKFASLYLRSTSKFVPDFHGVMVEDEEWLTFSCEHIGAILKNMM